MFFTKNYKITSTSKYIKIKYLIIKNLLKNKDLSIESLELMLTDLLTKLLRFIALKAIL